MSLLNDKYSDLYEDEWFNGESALHIAVRTGDVKQVQSLLSSGVDVNARSDLGITPIFWVLDSYKDEILQMLLDAGADLEVYDNPEFGVMQSWYIFVHGSRRAMEIVINSGFDFTKPTMLLHYLAKNHDKDVIRLFEDVNLDANMARSKGWTILHAACTQHNFEYAKILLRKGANPNCEFDGYFPVHDVIRSRGLAHSEKSAKLLMKLLIENGANITLSTPSHGTVIRYAIQQKWIEVIEPVLEHLAIMEAKGLPIQDCHNDIQTNATVKNYYDECKEEIKRMQLEVSGNVSFFNILIDPVEQNEYLRDPCFVELIKSDVDVKFPHYAAFLKMQLEKAVKKTLT